MEAIQTPMKKGRKIKLISMIVICLVSAGYGSWQVWIRIPQRTQEADVYRAAKTTYDNLIVIAGELKTEGKLLDQNQQLEYTEAEDVLSRFKDEKPQPPSKYDAIINLWLWVIGAVASIPFLIWPFWKFRHGGWILSENGSLTTPGGKVHPADQIKDIDMSTWRGLLDPQASNKTTWQAKIILANGQKVVIDDFLWENADKIIGRLAHQFHPDSWDARGELIAKTSPTEVKPASTDQMETSEK